MSFASFRSRLKYVLGVLVHGRHRRTRRTSASFRLMYERFREILNLNDTVLQLYADIEDRFAGRKPFSMDAMARRIKAASMDVFLMAKNLNQLTHGRHSGLYEALRLIVTQIEAEAEERRESVERDLAIPLSSLAASDSVVAGAKLANLGEVRRKCGLSVPDGFVVTTAAFERFMTENELWDRAERLEVILESRGQSVLSEACGEVRTAILSAPIPGDLARIMLERFDELADGGNPLIAVRSSAVGEDGSIWSHAGQYATELNVDRDGLLEAWRSVVASAYDPGAVTYRFERGITAWETAMAVGCLRMVEPRCSGILFTRKPEDVEEDALVLSAVSGIAADLASGQEAGQSFVVVPGREEESVQEPLDVHDIRRIVQAARRLETHFEGPQDVEWALDLAGDLFILQTRPLVTSGIARGRLSLADHSEDLILSGGNTVCPGVGVGPAIPVRSERDLDGFPDGGVLVARHSSPAFSRVMGRCAAIVTEVGSPTGHMAILCREAGVPSVVGMDGAISALGQGFTVTLDAEGRRVYSGRLVVESNDDFKEEVQVAPPETPAYRRLVRVSEFVIPLHLTDPSGPDFSPANCRSLHDITRYVHEMSYKAMFYYGNLAEGDREHSVKLEVDLPIEIQVFDVGEGIRMDGGEKSRNIRMSDIASMPMTAFLEGMLQVRWRHPRPVSARGFMSVLGQGMAAPPASARVGRVSYAIISDRYMNFSTKAGYHFSTVDTYCGQSRNKNYIHFRFNGGAADHDRRIRRIRFISTVLTQLDFRVRTKGDLLSARLQKYDQPTIQSRLKDMGRLTMCTRQLDMLMDADRSVDFFAQSFLSGDLDSFY